MVRSGPARALAASVASTKLLWLMVVLNTIYVVALSLPGRNLGLLGGLGGVAVWAPAAVCWRAVGRTGLERVHVLLAAAAVTVYTLSNAFYVLMVHGSESSVPFVSTADLGYLAFYPLMLAAVGALVHRQLRELTWTVLLDSALGALGAASVLAVVLGPVISAADGWSAATMIALGTPLFDLLLVAAVVGIAVSPGLDLGRRWIVLAVGLGAFAATDTIYALQVTNGSNEFGTPLDAGWVIGLSLIAVSVDWSSGSLPRTHPRGGTVALAVPAAATAAAMGVLILATQVDLSVLPVLLAGLTLVAAAGRTQIAFRQVVRMSDLRSEARMDDLTGLPNRRALYTDVPTLLEASDGRPRALLLLDLDRFKEVNDSLGHHVGDRLLVQVGKRLTHDLHVGDLLARLGGDEFAILLADTGHDEAVVAALRLREALAEPFMLEGISLQTDVSIGIALFPGQGRDLSALLRRADMAMYRAKTARVGYRIYTGADDTQGDARLRTLDELRTALSCDELVVHYQPKVTLATGIIHGVEALVRWDHPSRGLLYPDAFVELVEDSGLMRAMTQVVLEKALDQAAAWQAAGNPLTVAVNLSARSLMDAELPHQVSKLIAARGLPTSALMLEITEELLMADRDRARSILTRLRDSGIQIAVDDFGTGYSSLAYLRDLPIDELKLDKSFVFPMADDARAAALVASTIALAHSVDLRMVAEGVENQVAYAELARYGCDEAQGHWMSRPVPAAVLDVWLEERRAIRRLAGR